MGRQVGDLSGDNDAHQGAEYHLSFCVNEKLYVFSLLDADFFDLKSEVITSDLILTFNLLNRLAGRSCLL